MHATAAVALVALVAMTAGSALPSPSGLRLEQLPRDRAALVLKEVLRPHLETGLRSSVTAWARAHSASAPAPAPRGLIENQILALLEKLRETMLNGDEEKGIPVLDPFVLAHAEIDLHEPLAEIVATLDNLTVTGLAGFKVNNLKVSTLTLTANFNVSMPEVLVVGQYDTDSVLGDLLPVYGKGDLEVTISNLIVVGKGKLALKGIKPYLKTLELTITLGGYHSEFSGLLGGGDLSDLINEVINDLVPEIVDANLPWVSDLIAEIAVKIVNKALGVEQLL